MQQTFVAASVRSLVNFVDLVEERNRRSRLPKRYIRDMEDPYSRYGAIEFRQKFRFTKDVVRNAIFPMVKNDLQKVTLTGLPIAPEVQLLLTLRYYATGSIQVSHIGE
jgi:hypothetical protein